MNHTIDKVFTPSTGIDIVFNLNSLTPSSRSSIIYDADHGAKSIIVAQPLVQIRPDTVPKEIHITTLIRESGNSRRFGIKCKPTKFDKSYRLSNNKTVGAITLQYEPVMVETNIRSAYRLPLGKNHGITATLVYKGETYCSSKDFSIRDISLSGISLIIPRMTDIGRNALREMERNEQATIELALIDMESDKPDIIIASPIKITRTNTSHTKTDMLAGAMFIRLKLQEEERLNRFIHNAQMEELARLSWQS